MAPKLKLLDLFSGIGGFSLGLERTGGFETVAFCEISAKCRHLLNHHWPEVPTYDDVCTLTGERLAADGIAVDAICGGFPCQDISFAGKGAGLAGERSGLWREYSRLIRELRPRVIIVENVAALLGRGLGDVLGDLAAFRYDAWWDCIPASAVGAPHRRDRLWLVAYARSKQHEGCGDALRRAVAAQLSGAALADPDSARLALAGLAGEAGQGDGRVKSRATVDGSRSPRGAPAVGHTHCAPADAHPAQGGPRGATGEPSGRRAESLLGGMAHGLSAGMDRLHGGWAEEPPIPRVAKAVPARVDRLHGLGNAVVPQIPELIGRAILASLAVRSEAA